MANTNPEAIGFLRGARAEADSAKTKVSQARDLMVKAKTRDTSLATNGNFTQASDALDIAFAQLDIAATQLTNVIEPGA